MTLGLIVLGTVPNLVLIIGEIIRGLSIKTIFLLPTLLFQFPTRFTINSQDLFTVAPDGNLGMSWVLTGSAYGLKALCRG